MHSHVCVQPNFTVEVVLCCVVVGVVTSNGVIVFSFDFYLHLCNTILSFAKEIAFNESTCQFQSECKNHSD